MDLLQKRTYLLYSRGLKTNDLTLGSLFLDPANPLDGEHKRFLRNSGYVSASLYQLGVFSRRYHLHSRSADRNACDSLEELENWTGETEVDEPCKFTTTVGREWLAGAGLINTLSGGVNKSNSFEVSVAGEKGRRFQIKRPEAFLNDVLLQDGELKTWLSNQLSIAQDMSRRSALRRLGLKSPKVPKIWMVTGVQYIANASVESAQTQSHSTGVKLKLPMPEPVTAAATILLPGNLESISLEASKKRSSESKSASHHADERVWAAQFNALDVKFLAQVGETLEGRHIPLSPLEDLAAAGIRAGEEFHESKDEIAVIQGLETNDDAHQTDLLKIMLDVDWEMLNTYYVKNEE